MATFPDSDVAATSVQRDGDGLLVRVYEHNGRRAQGLMTTEGLLRGSLRSLRGEELDGLSPYQIGTVSLVPSQRG